MGRFPGFDWDVPGGVPTVVVLALLFAVIGWGGFRELATVTNPQRRRWLRVLRVITAVAAFLVAAQPAWTGAKIEATRGRLAVLMDTSRSMSVSHGDASRRAEAQKFLADHPELDGKDVALFTVSDEARAETLTHLRTAYAPEAASSNLRTSVLNLARAGGSDAIGSVLLVSDGADRSEGENLSDLVATGVKVHTALVGGDQPLVDDTILFAKGDAVAFVRQEARVLVRVRSSRGAGTFPVSLRQDDHQVANSEVTLDANGEGEVDLRFTPSRVGRTAYQVYLPIQPDDDVPDNNTVSFLVTVRRDKLRVLHVTGRPNWDQRFLRAFLKRDPTIDLVSFFILRTDTDLAMAGNDELALIPFPTDELFSEHLDSFDVVLFQDFNYGPYDMARYLPRIRDYVEHGGAFAMVGGELSFSAGGYVGTPVAEVLPVTLPPSSSPTDSVDLGPFRPVLDRNLMRHPILALRQEPAANLEAWSKLAPLEGANIFRDAKDGAQVLLRHPTADGGAMPVLAIREAGKGRTLAFGTDSSWRWGLTTGGETGDASAYNGFWDRAFRWLTRDPAFEPVHIATDRDRAAPKERIAVRGMARDPQFVPMAGRALALSVLRDDGKAEGEPWSVTADARGALASTFAAPARPGLYRLVLRDGAGDAVPPLAEELFLVAAGSNEMLDPQTNAPFLRNLSAQTRGTHFAKVGAVPDLRTLDAVRERIIGQTRTKPFASWWFVTAALGLFATEWFLRRRWGRR